MTHVALGEGDLFVCDSCGRADFKTRAGLVSHAKACLAAAPEAAPPPPGEPEGHPDELAPGGTRFRAPAVIEKSRGGIMRVLRGGKANEPKAPRVPRAPVRGRRSLAGAAEGVYRWLGRGMVDSGIPELVPTGRAAVMFAPAAGHHWDEVLKGTWVDSKLQPMAAKGEAYRAVGASIGFPLVVAACSARPNIYPMMRPVLEEMLEENILAMGPALREKAKRRAEMYKVLDEMDAAGYTAFDIAEQPVDPRIGAILDAIFAPPPPAPEARPPEAAGGPG